MSSDDTGEAIESLKAELFVATDRELAERLGIDPTAVSAWRRRKSVPAKYRLRIARLRDELADEANSSTPSFYRLSTGYRFALIGVAAKVLSDSVRIISPDDEYQEMWLGFTLRRLNGHVERALARCPSGDKDALRSEYQRLRQRLLEPGLYPWIESLPDDL